jgi:CRP/FNR family transcriptional regulator, cyclic AMP receptor protein
MVSGEPITNAPVIDHQFERSKALNRRISLLRRNETFASLSDADAGSIARLFHERSVERHAVLFSAADSADSVLFIKHGFVRLHRPMASGREVSFGIIGPGDFLGSEAAIENNVARTATATTLTGVNYFAASASNLALLMRRSLAVTLCLTRETLRRHEELETRLAMATFACVRARIEYTLAQLALAHGTRGEDGTMRLPARLTHQDIASLAGTYRETASLALGDLRRKGRVRLDASGTLSLLNPERMLLNVLGSSSGPEGLSKTAS